MSPAPLAGGRRRGTTVKTLKKVLKRAGLKTTGKKATLTRRAKKARLMGGQISKAVEKAGESAKALVQAPIKGVKAAL